MLQGSRRNLTAPSVTFYMAVRPFHFNQLLFKKGSQKDAKYSHLSAHNHFSFHLNEYLCGRCKDIWQSGVPPLCRTYFRHHSQQRVDYRILRVLIIEDMARFLETLSVCLLITNTQRRASTLCYQYVTFTQPISILVVYIYYSLPLF